MIKRIPQILIIICILLIIFGRLHLSIVRYFDSDEMSHMHWAWLVAQGKIPYRDFFYYNLPGYQYLIAWPFLLAPSSSILILTRIWQLIMFVFSAVLLHRITKKITGSARAAFLSTFIFLTFPMTFDKTIDIRPDISMMLLYLFAVDIILSTTKWYSFRLIILGISASVSVLVTLKTIIFAFPALIYIFLSHRPHPTFKQILLAVVGIIVPAALFIFMLYINGAIQNAITMIFKDGFAVSAGKLPFSPWKALSPWPLVYLDRGGDSWPWRVNIGIWISAALGLILFSIYNFKKSIFLIIFYIFGIAFLFLFPAPYLQYFVPLSVFGSLLSAYFINFIIDFAGHICGKYVFIFRIAGTLIIITILLFSFWEQYYVRISPASDNSEQLGVITDILKLTKPDERFYDMVGSYIFRPDGYIICCHPYAEFIDKLSIKVPSLRDSLIQTQTKYVLMDRTAMVFWQPKPDDLAFLKSHYLVSPKNWKIYPHGYKFGCLDGKCLQIDIDNHPISQTPVTSFYTLADDMYKIATVPNGRTVTINNTVYGDQTTNRLAIGSHTFTVDKEIRTFTIQLDR
jgi:hypothetical protein